MHPSPLWLGQTLIKQRQVHTLAIAGVGGGCGRRGREEGRASNLSAGQVSLAEIFFLLLRDVASWVCSLFFIPFGLIFLLYVVLKISI